MSKIGGERETDHLYDHFSTSGKVTGVGVKESYHQIDHFTNAMLWEPEEPDERAKLCVITMHGGYSREMRHSLMQEFAKRGFRAINVLPAQYDFPSQMRDFTKAVDFARSLPGVEKVVLMGQSRGASIMSAYQRVAENGVKVFQGPGRRIQFPDIGPLSPADGLMLLDANYGFMQMLGISPCLLREGHATEFNPELDAINPANGYAPQGAHYSPEFCRKFWDAQRERYMRLMDMAEERLHLIEQGKGDYFDDEPLYVAEMHGMLMSGGKLFCMDTHFFSHTAGEWPLIHPDGSITTQIVPSVRIAKCDPKSRGLLASAWPVTIRSFLQSEVRLAEGWGYDESRFTGVDFNTCMTSPTGNVSEISVPLLCMGMTGSFEYITAEWTYNNAKSQDKTIAFTEGASHGFYTAKETEAYPGQWGDGMATTADYASRWLLEKGRFF